MPIFYFLLYLVFCMAIGLVGRSMPLGFAGFFLISFFLTPLVGIVLLVVSIPCAPRPQ
jgi:hypothetical protein